MNVFVVYNNLYVQFGFKKFKGFKIAPAQAQ